MAYNIKMTSTLGPLMRLDRRVFPKPDAPYTDRDAQWWMVSEDDKGHFVGYACAKILHTRPQTCYLTRVGVAKRHRGHGLQRRLIRARERWAAARNCTEVVTYVSAHNVHSLNALIACGYKACEPGDVGYGELEGFLTVRRSLV